MNFAGDEVFVQVANHDPNELPYVIKDEKPQLLRLIINSKNRLHLSLVGKKVFWSSYKSTEVFYFDLTDEKRYELPLNDYSV